MEHAMSKINEWKAHLLRARNQEEARINIVKDLDETAVLITCDWAMKFLPRKYREGQTDWYGKRGINWHVAVSFHRRGEEVKSLTHIHLFNSQVSTVSLELR